MTGTERLVLVAVVAVLLGVVAWCVWLQLSDLSAAHACRAAGQQWLGTPVNACVRR